ncbi:MAG TPA: zf-HC2 domain-containing protein [Thermoanaerobaculia bacterium]
MTAQAVHLDRDLLSAYLDRELPAREAARVEEHVAACPGCRARLDGLARVVGALARLERAAPPPSLAQHVERRVALEVDRRGWVADVERRLSTFAPQSPLLVGFTLTIALAVILYLFTVWAATPQRSDVSLRPAPAEAARSLLDRVEGRRLGGRELIRRGDEWREVSALDAVPERTVALGGEEAAELVARHPWLAELIAEGATVVFRDGDEVVELRPATAGDETPPVPAPPAP